MDYYYEEYWGRYTVYLSPNEYERLKPYLKGWDIIIIIEIPTMGMSDYCLSVEECNPIKVRSAASWFAVPTAAAVPKNEGYTLPVSELKSNSPEERRGRRGRTSATNKKQEKPAMTMDFGTFMHVNDYDMFDEIDYDIGVEEYSLYIEDMATNNKEEKAMDTTARDQRSHLQSRASNIYYRKNDELVKEFKLDTKFPHYDIDKIEWTQKKWFEIKEETNRFGETAKRVVWKDPDHTPDKKGYDAALEKLTAAFTALKDDIAIKTPAEALESLREFEKATFH